MGKTEKQVRLARGLRQRQTNAEQLLWSKLRNRRLEGSKFRRQQPIGPYIVDFVNFDQRLVIELDGGQHNPPDLPPPNGQEAARDRKRQAWLVEHGYQVLRFWNNEVLASTEAVLEKIREALHSRAAEDSPSPRPSPLKGEGGLLSSGGRGLR